MNRPFISSAITLVGISSVGGVLTKFEKAESLSSELVAEYPMTARLIDGIDNHLDTSIVGPDDDGPIKPMLPCWT